jgi:hypothetical protein
MGIGTNILDIKPLTIKELEHWDVLQYEGQNQGIALEIRHKFSDKMHFHHSCIKKIDPLSIDLKNESIGHQLAQSVLNNPDGKVIFSTRHKDYLNTNIDAFLKALENN